MNRDENELVLAWLNDARGMEQALIQILEHQTKDAREYSMVEQRLQQHLEETRQHVTMVESCIERLGGKTSTIKSLMSNLFGQMQAVSTGAAQDEMVKNALADYAAENFEVASYTALISAAQAIGDTETVRVCETILQQDRQMAQWLESSLPTLVQESMTRLATAAR